MNFLKRMAVQVPMRTKTTWIAFLVTVVYLVPIISIGQILTPAKWSNKLSNASPSVGETIDVVFTATIEKDWYLYSSDFDPDLGPMVTEFEFEPNDTYELVGGIVPQNPKKKYAGTRKVGKKIPNGTTPITSALGKRIIYAPITPAIAPLAPKEGITEPWEKYH